MKNKWNLFWKDYGAEAKSGIRFVRKHWIGTLMYCAIVALYIIGCYTDVFADFYLWAVDKASVLKEKVTSFFKKGKHEK